VQTRIDALSKPKHVPKDIDLNAAKSGLADATAAWDKAQTAFKSGNARMRWPQVKMQKPSLIQRRRH